MTDNINKMEYAYEPIMDKVAKASYDKGYEACAKEKDAEIAELQAAVSGWIKLRNQTIEHSHTQQAKYAELVASAKQYHYIPEIKKALAALETTDDN